ncbi:MAG: hypothetical protein AAFY76_01640 [Cyanobacteria bacterium J06649_11]
MIGNVYQPLIFDLLEELKLNHVQRAKEKNPEATMSEAMKISEQLTVTSS